MGVEKRALALAIIAALTLNQDREAIASTPRIPNPGDSPSSTQRCEDPEIIERINSFRQKPSEVDWGYIWKEPAQQTGGTWGTINEERQFYFTCDEVGQQREGPNGPEVCSRMCLERINPDPPVPEGQGVWVKSGSCQSTVDPSRWPLDPQVMRRNASQVQITAEAPPSISSPDSPDSEIMKEKVRRLAPKISLPSLFSGIREKVGEYLCWGIGVPVWLWALSSLIRGWRRSVEERRRKERLRWEEELARKSRKGIKKERRMARRMVLRGLKKVEEEQRHENPYKAQQAALMRRMIEENPRLDVRDGETLRRVEEQAAAQVIKGIVGGMIVEQTNFGRWTGRHAPEKLWERAELALERGTGGSLITQRVIENMLYDDRFPPGFGGLEEIAKMRGTIEAVRDLRGKGRRRRGKRALPPPRS